MRQASEKQVDYMSSLFIDCGFTLAERKAFLTKRFNREVCCLDDLTSAEASQVISELRAQRERKWNPEDCA